MGTLSAGVDLLSIVIGVGDHIFCLGGEPRDDRCSL